MTDLVAAARRARNAALDHLLAERGADGSWTCTFDVSAFPSALFILMLRTTGLVEAPGARDWELRLARHLTVQVNSDGGFYKFPGAGSDPDVTRVAMAALRAVRGEIEPGTRCRAWFAPNPGLDDALDAKLAATLAAARSWLDGSRRRRPPRRTSEHGLLANVILRHAEGRDARRWRILGGGACLGAFVLGQPLLRGAARQFSHLLRRMLPALWILQATDHDSEVVRRLVAHVRATQNACGGWVFNTGHTMLNVMALAAAGADPDDPAIRRAWRHLQENLVRVDGEGAFLNAQLNDVWNTSHGVWSYLAVPGHRAADAAIRPSISYLVDAQRADGAHAWNARSAHDAENDSTGFALKSLALARATADAADRPRLDEAVRRAVRFLARAQDRRGGFSAWDATRIEAGPGPPSLPMQLLFDPASADVTARVLDGLAAAGLTLRQPTVARAVRFLLRKQHANGGWWSRWWAGYLAGTCRVLEVLGSLGIEADATSLPASSLETRARRALARAQAFLLAHQNPDGGWGETIEADRHPRFAAQGASTPLHTARVVSALLGSGTPALEPVVRRGVAYLLEARSSEGTWNDRQVTCTFFAGSFYYHYSFLNRVLPLDALTLYLRAALSPAPARGARQPGSTAAGGGAWAAPRGVQRGAWPRSP